MDCGWLLVCCHLYLGKFYGDSSLKLLIKSMIFVTKLLSTKEDMYDCCGILNYGKKYEYLKLDTVEKSKL